MLSHDRTVRRDQRLSVRMHKQLSSTRFSPGGFSRKFDCSVRLTEFTQSLYVELPEAGKRELLALTSKLRGANEESLYKNAISSWLTRTYLPTFLDLAGLPEEAESLRTVDGERGRELAILEAVLFRVRETEEAIFDAAQSIDLKALRVASWDTAADSSREQRWAKTLYALRNDVTAASYAAARASGPIAYDYIAYRGPDGATRFDTIASTAAIIASAPAVLAEARAAMEGREICEVNAYRMARQRLAPTVETLQQSALAMLEQMLNRRPTNKETGVQR